MNLIIRPAQLHDIPYIMQIYNAEIEHGVATWNNQPKSLEEYQQWFQYLQEAEFPLFVAEETETQVISGYAEYSSFRNFNGYDQTVEHAVIGRHQSGGCQRRCQSGTTEPEQRLPDAEQSPIQP